MKRRDALIGSAILAGIPSGLAFAQTGKKKLGDTIIPPEKEAGKEKHVPMIDAPAHVKAGEPFVVTVEVGKTVPHPNTMEHHISWIQLYALEEGSQYVVELASFNFTPTFAAPKVQATIILKKNATLYALEHCNLHGIWDNSMDVMVM